MAKALREGCTNYFVTIVGYPEHMVAAPWEFQLLTSNFTLQL